MWKRRFTVDVESGSFFEVNEVTSDGIKILCNNSIQEATKKLSNKYGEKLAIKTLCNLSKLKKEGLLFSSRQSQNQCIKRSITDLTLNIVNNCNLSCLYCWNQKGGYGRNFANDQKMNEQVAFKAVDLLIKETKEVKDLVIDFYGGEPLLNFDLIKKTINYCKKIQKKEKIKFRFLLATNGTLLTKERGEFLIENGVDIAISIDGNQEIQDLQRPFPNGKGSFNVIMDNINSLKKDYRKRIVGRATFTPHSTGLIRAFKFLRQLGFDRIEICESEKAGYGLESKDEFFFVGAEGIEHLKSLYYRLSNFYTKEIIKGRLTYENTYFNRFFKQLSRLYHIQSIEGACSAGSSLIAVDLDGNIYPCTAFVGIPQFRIGSVTKGINEETLRSFLGAQICTSEICNKCWAKRICRGCGSCYNLNYFTNKNLRQPDSYYCEMFRYKTKLMIAMISEVTKKSPQTLDRLLIPEYYVTRGRRKNEN